MKIKIRIQRKTTNVAGTLEAWVVDGDAKGVNLLSGQQVSGVSTAMERITRKLQSQYHGEVSITWDLPE